MKRKDTPGIVLLVGMALAVSLILYVFFPPRIPPFNVVRVDGMSTYGNYLHFISIVKEYQNRKPALLLWENDLLYITDAPTDTTFFMPYKKSDGTQLSFRKEGALLLRDDKPISLNIRGNVDGGAWEWLKTAGKDQIRSLRFLTITAEGPAGLDLSRIELLKKVAGINPHVGLSIDAKHIDQVLSLFKPHMLVLSVNSPPTEKQITVLSNEQQLRTLWLSFSDKYHTADPDNKGFEFLSRLPHLTSLGITGGIEDSRFPPRLKNIRSLTLFLCKIRDLPGLARFTGLRELSLLYGEFGDTNDVTPLSKLNNLITLDLAGSGDVSNISALKNMRGLRYVGLPFTISQEDFASLIDANPDLRILRLIGCQEVTDIGPLKKLRSLDALILLLTSEKDHPRDLSYYAPLREMRSLRYLALDEEVVDNDEEMRALEKALPKCQIVTAKGVCLGSGWILLLPAVILLSFHAKKIYRTRL